MATIKELLDYGREKLESSGNEYAKYERKVLLERVLSVDYMYMLMNGDETVSEDMVSEYEHLIARRCEHYPLQYLLGHAYFMDYTFYVDENVLIPRSDTEILVETVNEMYDSICNRDNGKADLPNSSHDRPRLLDLCCGSGCIGISLKLYHKEISLTLTDVSDRALLVTRKNLDFHDINDAVVNKGDLFDGLDDIFDIIVCNPPYIESEIIKTLMPEVREYEPILALDGGIDGLDFYREIVDKISNHLNCNGYIFFEIGHDQGKAVSKLMVDAGFKDVIVRKDYAGMDRVLYGHL